MTSQEEKELGRVERELPPDASPETGLPLSFLYATAAVGTYVQIPCSIKVWFDASQVSLLLQGVETAFVPYNAPTFSVYPVLSRQCYEYQERQAVEEAAQRGCH